MELLEDEVLVGFELETLNGMCLLLLLLLPAPFSSIKRVLLSFEVLQVASLSRVEVLICWC